MDPLSGIASIATIVTLIGPTTKLIKSLYGIASDEGIVAKEISRMANRLQTSSVSIDIGLEDLKGRSKILEGIQSAPSEVLQYIIDNESVEKIVSGTEAVSKQMSDIERDLNDMKERPKIIKKLKWCLWSKMEMESLFPEMQLVASCLSLVRPIISHEIDQYLLKGSSGTVALCLEQQMESRRSQMKLFEKQFRRNIKEQHSSVDGESNYEAQFEAVTEPLLNLSRSNRLFVYRYRVGLRPTFTAKKGRGQEKRKDHYRENQQRETLSHRRGRVQKCQQKLSYHQHEDQPERFTPSGQRYHNAPMRQQTANWECRKRGKVKGSGPRQVMLRIPETAAKKLL
ncbi:hypothetical protein IL306_014743 [Fusarium sp. DS 682]|nr:hypothetical protein IL306_014743 [Fusarium sp. DS 682]